MSVFELNPWGFTSLFTVLVSVLFVYFLWRIVSPSLLIKRFTVLLLIENIAILTSSAGIELLLNYKLTGQTETILALIHHLTDVLLLALYPVFVAHALPVKALKPLTTVRSRYALYTVGSVVYALLVLMRLGFIESSFEPDTPLYLLLVIMFVVMLVFSAFAVKKAKTQLEKEKAMAFVCAFGVRDLAWAAVYFAAVTGLIMKAPMFFNQLYVGATLVYIPIMIYGILKVQLLDIEIRLKSTIKNTLLGGAFIAFFYLISEGTNEFLSSQLGGVVAFVVSILLTIFLSPLHRWAEHVASRLIHGDIDSPDYSASRGLQIYSAAVEEALAYGAITRGQIALLDRLRESLQLPEDDARAVEQGLNLNRASAQ